MNKDIHGTLSEVWEAIKALDARIAKIEVGVTGIDGNPLAASAPAKKMSIREFLLKYPPSTDVQRTLAVGYYFETHGGMRSFTRSDLENGYRDAKHSLPSNMSMNIRHCIKAGHMMEAKEKKDNKPAYVVTGTGEQFVEGYFKKPNGK